MADETTTTTVATEPAQTPAQIEAKFVDDVVVRLDTQKLTPKGDTKAEKTEGSEKPKKAPKAKAEQKAAKPTDEIPKPTAEKGEKPKQKLRPGEEPEPTEPGEFDDVEEAEPVGADAEGVEQDEDDEELTPEEITRQALDEEDDLDNVSLKTIEKKLREHGLTAALDDLPPEAAAIVKARIEQMRAPFTRAMQEATAFRKEQATLKAELRFIKENPADAIVDMLRANPTLGEAINAKLDELDPDKNPGHATVEEARKVVVERRKALAIEAEQREAQALEQSEQRAEQVEAYARRTAGKLGVPYSLGVEPMIALHVREHGDITREDIDRIVSQQARAYINTLREQKRNKAGQYVKDKLADRATAGLKVKPNVGLAPAPGKGPTPKNDSDFLAHAEGKLASMGM